MLTARLGGTEGRPLWARYRAAKSSSRNRWFRFWAKYPYRVSRPTKSRYKWSAANSGSCGERVPIMTVAPGPAVRQLLTRGLAQQHQVGAVEHFPGDGLAGFQIESR